MNPRKKKVAKEKRRNNQQIYNSKSIRITEKEKENRKNKLKK